MNGFLASLHAERVSRQPLRVSTHAITPGVQVKVVEQHGSHLGSSLWHSALAFSAYICGRHELWAAPRRCLELGAGCGTVGIVAACSSVGHTVVLTDKPEVCEHMEVNKAANAAAIQAAGAQVCVRPLSWLMPQEDAAAVETAQSQGDAEWAAVLLAAGLQNTVVNEGSASQRPAFDIVLASE